ncbi:MAG: PAS domain-containing protein [Bacteroidota bacterium]
MALSRASEDGRPPPSLPEIVYPLPNAPEPEVVRHALNAVNNLVVITDPRLPDNPIVWVNDYFFTFTGYRREEVIGRNCRFLQRNDRDQAARHVLRDGIEGGQHVNVVLRNYKKDGTLFYNDLYVSPVYDETGALIHFIGVQNDATTLEEALQTIRERDQQLYDLTESERERFAMELHEGLGQVLTGAALSASAHLRELERDAPAHVASAQIMSDLIQRAVSEARQIAQGLSPVLDQEDGLRHALDDLATSMNEASEEAQVTAVLAEVPTLDQRAARHLYRIAQEAVANALKHADAEHIVIRLRDEPSGAVVLEIEDDGVGIPASVVSADQTLSTGRRVAEEAQLAQHGRGLYSMRFRANQIGATLTVEHRDEGGTRVRCHVAPSS